MIVQFEKHNTLLGVWLARAAGHMSLTILNMPVPRHPEAEKNHKCCGTYSCMLQYQGFLQVMHPLHMFQLRRCIPAHTYICKLCTHLALPQTPHRAAPLLASQHLQSRLQLGQQLLLLLAMLLLHLLLPPSQQLLQQASNIFLLLLLLLPTCAARC